MGDDTKTQTRLIGQWRAFCAWLIVNHGEPPEAITKVTREQVILYGQYLKSEFDNGRLANTNTVASYLSGMNTLMKRVNPDWEKVSAVKECGLETISHISNKEPELDKNGLPEIESLAGYLLELQMSLGVTVREALILDLKAALVEGRTSGFVTVTNPQSGTRRTVPTRPTAIKAIGHGIAARRLQKRLPKKWAFDDFMAAHNKLAARKGYSTNTARSVYARNRYQELTGVEPPNISGLSQADHWQQLSQHTNKTLSEAKGLDKNTRRTIAREIGMLGIDTFNCYLDK